MGVPKPHFCVKVKMFYRFVDRDRLNRILIYLEQNKQTNVGSSSRSSSSSKQWLV